MTLLHRAQTQCRERQPQESWSCRARRCGESYIVRTARLLPRSPSTDVSNKHRRLTPVMCKSFTDGGRAFLN
eukprot:2363809-Pyramimonas_sp.AAC.1